MSNSGYVVIADNGQSYDNQEYRAIHFYNKEDEKLAYEHAKKAGEWLEKSSQLKEFGVKANTNPYCPYFDGMRFSVEPINCGSLYTKGKLDGDVMADAQYAELEIILNTALRVKEKELKFNRVIHSINEIEKSITIPFPASFIIKDVSNMSDIEVAIFNTILTTYGINRDSGWKTLRVSKNSVTVSEI